MGPDALGTYLFDWLWQSSLWLAVGLAGATLLARRPARAHGVLLIAIAGAVVTPLLTILFRSLGWGLLAPADAIVAAAPHAETHSPAAGATAAVPGLGWVGVIAAAWVALSMIATIRLVVSLARGARLVSRARPIASAPHERLACQVARRLGLSRTPELCVTSDVRSPVIWCWGRRPRILLPEQVVADRGRLFGILCHELAHLRREDHLAGIAAEIGACVLPWNPLVWWAKRRAGHYSEQACDAWVVAAGESPTSYAEALLALASQPVRPWALAAVSKGGGMRGRIRNILEHRRTDPDAGGRWMPLCAVAALLLVATSALAHRRAPQTVEPADRVLGKGGDVLILPSVLDLGDGEPFEQRTGSVWVINLGEEPAAINDALANCECTAVDFQPGVLQPGDSMKVDITTTAPATPGARKNKQVTFDIEGQHDVKLPVQLKAADPRT